MADFRLAMPTVFSHEGRYSNNPKDPGGATKWGISLRFLKTLPNCENKTEADIASLTQQQAAVIFKEQFWDGRGYEYINDQSIATKIFDESVNIGSYHSHLLAQRAVRAAIGIRLEEDGIIGLKTITGINMCKPYMLMPALKSEYANYYRHITYPGSNTFMLGWLTRAYSNPLLDEKE